MWHRHCKKQPPPPFFQPDQFFLAHAFLDDQFAQDRQGHYISPPLSLSFIFTHAIRTPTHTTMASPSVSRLSTPPTSIHPSSSDDGAEEEEDGPLRDHASADHSRLDSLDTSSGSGGSNVPLLALDADEAADADMDLGQRSVNDEAVAIAGQGQDDASVGEEEEEEEEDGEDDEDMDDDEEEDDFDCDRISIWRGKHIADGCETLLEMAHALRNQAAELESMHASGHHLMGEVVDDYGHILDPPEDDGEDDGDGVDPLVYPVRTIHSQPRRGGR